MATEPTLNPKIIEVTKGHGLVLYDGDCGFCQFWVKFILKRDQKAYFLFASLQSNLAKHIYAHYDRTPDLTTVLLFENGALLEKSTAALRIAGHLDGLWKYLNLFFIVPTRIRDFVYDIIAKNRHRFISKDFCEIPNEETRKRFLNDERGGFY